MKLGLFGRAVSHSRSPKLFARLSRSLKRPLSYERVPVAPGLLPVACAWAKVVGWTGASVTIPYKLEAFEMCEKTTSAAEAIGAVNALKFGKKLEGHNTDGDGLSDALKRAKVPLKGKTVCVFGSGGGARAAGYAAALNGALKVRFFARNKATAKDTAVQLGKRFAGTEFAVASERHDKADVWINATPLGMKGHPSRSPVPRHFKAPSFAYDLVYGRKTPFLSQAARLGARTEDGKSMLAFQALRALEFWGVPLGPKKRAALVEGLIQELS